MDKSVQIIQMIDDLNDSELDDLMIFLSKSLPEIISKIEEWRLSKGLDKGYDQ